MSDNLIFASFSCYIARRDNLDLYMYSGTENCQPPATFCLSHQHLKLFPTLKFLSNPPSFFANNCTIEFLKNFPSPHLKTSSIKWLWEIPHTTLGVYELKPRDPLSSNRVSRCWEIDAALSTIMLRKEKKTPTTSIIAKVACVFRLNITHIISPFKLSQAIICAEISFWDNKKAKE